jgi:DNA-binding MarR family transcriptional regulator
MTRQLTHIAELPPHLRAEARRKSEHVTLRPYGTARRIMQILLIAADEEFSMRELVRRAYLHRNSVNPACARLELLGLITIRADRNARRLQGGAPPRWVRLTESGRAVAAREGISADPVTSPAGMDTTAGRRP